MPHREMVQLIYCGFCGEWFKDYKRLEHLVNPNKIAKCCPVCGICDYEKGANFRGDIKIIADLMFAFINKDEDFPHDFEIKAFEEAFRFLQEHYNDDKYNLKMFESHLNKMKECLN